MSSSDLPQTATLATPRAGVLRQVLWLTALLGLFFGLFLGSRPLGTPDEARYAEIPREMVASGNYVTPRLDGVKYFEKPPLVYWLQASAIRAFGMSEWSLRFWTALLALFGCVTVYLAGRALFGAPAGIASAVVLATSFLYYMMSRIVTLDMAVSVLLSAALLAFLTGERAPPGWSRRLLLWAFYVFAALAVLAKGLIGFVIPAMIIGVWIIVLWDWRVLARMQLASGLVLFLAISVPWHVLVQRANPEFAWFYFVHEHFERYLTKSAHRYQPPWFFIPILLVGLFPWTLQLWPALKRAFAFPWRERARHREVLFLGLWAALVFVFFSISDSKLIPYILPVFPPLALLIGRYVAQLWSGAQREGRAPYLVFAVIALVLAAVCAAVPHFRPGPDPVRLATVMYALAALLVATAVVAPLAFARAGSRAALATVVTGSALFFIGLNPAMPMLENRSIKPLAIQLARRLKPADAVATYHNYYQDLPFYLRRRVIIVDWKGELAFGASVEDVSGWMIDDRDFWKRWQGPGRMYAVMGLDDYRRLRATHADLYPVARDDARVVLCNQKRAP